MANLNRKPHFKDISHEVMMHIFKYLTASERNIASETCRIWYLTANDYPFITKKFITCDTLPVFKDTTCPIQTFLNSAVKFHNYLFYILRISDVVNDFWVQLGDKLRSLEIYHCELHYMDVDVILNSCKELEELRLFCNFLRPESPSTITNDKSNYLLPKLKSLDLSGSNVYDAILDKLVKCSPEIQKFNLSNCVVIFDSEISRIFPASETLSLTCLTFSYVLEFIKLRSNKIKHLMLPAIDDSVLISLSKCEDFFLESLEFNLLYGLTEEVLSEFFKQQELLKKLTLIGCVSNNCILDICRYHSDLEYLRIERCSDIDDYGISELHKLKKLKALYLPFMSSITKEGIKRGLNKQPYFSLEELRLPHLFIIGEKFLLVCMKLFPNLTYLDLSCCYDDVLDKSLQAVFKYQTQLEVLILKGCQKVYYLGACDENDELSNVRNDKTRTGLFSLKRLNELDLQGCCNVRSECIEDYFQLPNLVKLNLSDCLNITDENMKYIVQNCPNIEHLNVSNCEKLTIGTMEIIGTHLKYLKTLDINFCDFYTYDIEKDSMLLKSINASRRKNYRATAPNWTT